ncbi:hypothetical protein F2Q69_00010082 [Brassica cretica]|uniref:Uncharacterized protein n=1 Tax=Brassica cretica TaxID=69181 RepID=A0A8S9P3I9_BRACR|nr:hypothetical protein F2Q69_00010082 [Brassica cretica]
MRITTNNSCAKLIQLSLKPSLATRSFQHFVLIFNIPLLVYLYSSSNYSFFFYVHQAKLNEERDQQTTLRNDTNQKREQDSFWNLNAEDV